MKQAQAAEQGAATRGMQTFMLIWIGQLVSILGTNLTGFGLPVWIYQQTGSATQLTLLSFFGFLPVILLSPFAGVLVDRWNRKTTLILSDLGGALATISLVLLLWMDRLDVYLIYPIVIMSGCFGAFQFPAFAAAITQLVPKDQLGRASGMMQLAQAIGQLLAPAIAGVLVTTIGLEGVILIDFATCLFAIGTLLLVRIPNAERSAEGEAARGSVGHEALFGWRFITARRGLLALLLFFAASNFLMGTIVVLSTPLVLAFGTAVELGLVRSVAGVGMVVGGVVMSIWRGPKRRVYGALGGILLSGISMMIAGLAPSAILIAIAAFFFTLGMPLVGASSQPIWQSKVPVDLQGRVFGVRSTIATASMPLAYLISGPLVDYVFEPMMVPNGPLAGTFGTVIGTGEGRGIALMFIIMGFLAVLAVVAGYMYPRLRFVEDELPDAIPDNLPAEEAALAEQQPQLQHL
ncbi:MAG TPA: MFS transporter [Herpetosiphonaceae bacterium]